MTADLAYARHDTAKIKYLVRYFNELQHAKDRDLALTLLLGHYPRRLLTTKQLKQWAPTLTGYPEWLIIRSEKEAGNMADTLAILLSDPDTESNIQAWQMDWHHWKNFRMTMKDNSISSKIHCPVCLPSKVPCF
ncbi:MAG: hypothetical protein HC819_15750 [Cyclobacteriaceae bacterium]|nr:hypothetical protein [Cyclobacteriaceae bacterium]